MAELNDEKKLENVYYLTFSGDKNNFDESIYIKIRKKEGRVYSDEILKYLPEISKSHPLYKEWEVRKATMNSLIKYFSNKEKLSILDVGCGNGWLSNVISLKTNNFVTAVDLNKVELKQGARVFNNNKKLTFVYGNIFEDIFGPESFDRIIFSSSIQYFRNFQSLINRMFYFLKARGEIHIVDSNFYSISGAKKAKERSRVYYENLGVPEMENFYFYRTYKELEIFDYKILNRKSIYKVKFKRIIGAKRKTIFPWVRIIKN